MLDEFDDVILEGVALVSDDPSTWQIPASLEAAAAAQDADTRSVLYDWWEQLETFDTHLWDRLGGHDGVGRLCELAEQFQLAAELPCGTQAEGRHDGRSVRMMASMVWCLGYLAVGSLVALTWIRRSPESFEEVWGWDTSASASMTLLLWPLVLGVAAVFALGVAVTWAAGKRPGRGS